MSYSRVTIVSVVMLSATIESQASIGGNGRWADTDKLHDGAGGWLVNYWDDLNNDGDHDPGEPFADSALPEWTNPKSRPDWSCWMASACNMLYQVGAIPDAAALYMDYALNGIITSQGVLTWDDGGIQDQVIQYWMDQHPASGLQMQVYRRFLSFPDGLYAWQDWNPRSGVQACLRSGWEVSIALWSLETDGQGGYTHGPGHALTVQQVGDDMNFDCTDSDRDLDWSGNADVNRYADLCTGPVPYGGHDYHGWSNNYYFPELGDYPLGDVGYVCAIIPEPATISLLIAAGLFATPRRR